MTPAWYTQVDTTILGRPSGAEMWLSVAVLMSYQHMGTAVFVRPPCDTACACLSNLCNHHRHSISLVALVFLTSSSQTVSVSELGQHFRLFLGYSSVTPKLPAYRQGWSMENVAGHSISIYS